MYVPENRGGPGYRHPTKGMNMTEVTGGGEGDTSRIAVDDRGADHLAMSVIEDTEGVIRTQRQEPNPMPPLLYRRDPGETKG